jgi:hypothetical protein
MGAGVRGRDKERSDEVPQQRKGERGRGRESERARGRDENEFKKIYF